MPQDQKEFDPQEFWQLARALADDSEDEARLRTAIGRAYYAAFLVASTKAPPASGTAGRSPNRHIEVGKRICSYSSSAGAYLNGMREQRKHADYELTTPHLGWRHAWNQQLRFMDRLMPVLRQMPILFPEPHPPTDPSAGDHGGYTLRAPRPDKH